MEPWNVAVDLEAVVARVGHGHVSVRGEGQALGSVQGGLALTSDGHVAVADSGNHCFKVYRYLQ
ncbi:hypothetical protein CRUP_003301 [Coryphaenoides rupestris]|nr:hypothetical protein CRUP_003301 [Coryphaenoides rupestris]